MNEPETIAAYTGVLRHELKLAPGADPLLELELRLAPVDPRQRPPVRAPGIARLVKALRRLRAHKPPAASLDEFADDLRFLRAFEHDPAAWSPEAIDDLLANVIAAPQPRTRAAPRRKGAAARAPVPLRPHKPRGGA